MGRKTLIYKAKVQESLQQAFLHLQRLNDAIEQLKKQYAFPLSKTAYENINRGIVTLAFSDQIIYRFSKLQDTIGAKLFKALLLYQGESVDKPFLDILNQLEKIGIIDVEEWFELRDLRNEIAHDYGNDTDEAIEILNTIYKAQTELERILKKIEEMLHD